MLRTSPLRSPAENHRTRPEPQSRSEKCVSFKGAGHDHTETQPRTLSSRSQTHHRAYSKHARTRSGRLSPYQPSGDTSSSSSSGSEEDDVPSKQGKDLLGLVQRQQGEIQGLITQLSLAETRMQKQEAMRAGAGGSTFPPDTPGARHHGHYGMKIDGSEVVKKPCLHSSTGQGPPGATSLQGNEGAAIATHGVASQGSHAVSEAEPVVQVELQPHPVAVPREQVAVPSEQVAVPREQVVEHLKGPASEEEDSGYERAAAAVNEEHTESLRGRSMGGINARMDGFVPQGRVAALMGEVSPISTRKRAVTVEVAKLGSLPGAAAGLDAGTGAEEEALRAAPAPANVDACTQGSTGQAKRHERGGGTEENGGVVSFASPVPRDHMGGSNFEGTTTTDTVEVEAGGLDAPSGEGEKVSACLRNPPGSQSPQRLRREALERKLQELNAVEEFDEESAVAVMKKTGKSCCQLEVVVLSGRHVPAVKVLSGAADTFVSLYIDGMEATTTYSTLVQEGSTFPEWKEAFLMEEVRSRHLQLKLVLYNAITKVPIAAAAYALSSPLLDDQRPHTIWLPLQQVHSRVSHRQRVAPLHPECALHITVRLKYSTARRLEAAIHRVVMLEEEELAEEHKNTKGSPDEREPPTGRPSLAVQTCWKGSGCSADLDQNSGGSSQPIVQMRECFQSRKLSPRSIRRRSLEGDQDDAREWPQQQHQHQHQLRAAASQASPALTAAGGGRRGSVKAWGVSGGTHASERRSSHTSSQRNSHTPSQRNSHSSAEKPGMLEVGPIQGNGRRGSVAGYAKAGPSSRRGSAVQQAGFIAGNAKAGSSSRRGSAVQQAGSIAGNPKASPSSRRGSRGTTSELSPVPRAMQHQPCGVSAEAAEELQRLRDHPGPTQMTGRRRRSVHIYP